MLKSRDFSNKTIIFIFIFHFFSNKIKIIPIYFSNKISNYFLQPLPPQTPSQKHSVFFFGRYTPYQISQQHSTKRPPTSNPSQKHSVFFFGRYTPYKFLNNTRQKPLPPQTPHKNIPFSSLEGIPLTKFLKKFIFFLKK